MLLFLTKKDFILIAAFVADAASVNHNGASTFFANCANTAFINGEKTFINGPRSIRRNPPNCIILDSSAFDNYCIADKLLKTFQTLETYLLVINNFCGKLALSLELPDIFDDNIRVN